MNLQLNNTPKVRERLENWLTDNYKAHKLGMFDSGLNISYPTMAYELRANIDVPLPESCQIGLLREFVEAEEWEVENTYHQGKSHRVCHVGISSNAKPIVMARNQLTYKSAFLEAFTKWAKIREEEL